jgi:hypothetical protein
MNIRMFFLVGIGPLLLKDKTDQEQCKEDRAVRHDDCPYRRKRNPGEGHKNSHREYDERRRQKRFTQRIHNYLRTLDVLGQRDVQVPREPETTSLNLFRLAMVHCRKKHKGWVGKAWVLGCSLHLFEIKIARF